MRWQKAIYFGLPVKICFDEDCPILDSGFIVALLLPALCWFEQQFTEEPEFKFYTYDGWYIKGLYHWLFKPEVWHDT